MSDNVSIVTRMIRPFVVNEATTRRSEWYPDLEPAEFSTDPDAVFEAARRAIESRPRWRIVDEEPHRFRIDAEISTRIFGFIDDVRIEVEPGHDEVRVQARSRSRAGVGDFGQNARTIREFFDRLRAELD